VILVIILFVIILAFGFVIIFGAPYLPTMKKQQEQAFKLLNLKPGQKILELGSGDGRVLLAAARQGLLADGYELNPLLYLLSKAVCFKHRKQINVYYGNFWHKKWPKADGIFVFLHPRFMNKLDKKIQHEFKGISVKVVSYAFKIPGKKPQKTKDALYLYLYKELTK